MCKLNTLIVCYLLHTHTQLLIDPRSSNEITNCCTSSLARICVFTGMVLVCVYLWIYILSVVHLHCVHSLLHTHCTETHAAVMDYSNVMFMLSWVIYMYICLSFLKCEVSWPLASKHYTIFWHLNTTPFSLLAPSSIFI